MAYQLVTIETNAKGRAYIAPWCRVESERAKDSELAWLATIGARALAIPAR